MKKEQQYKFLVLFFAAIMLVCSIALLYQPYLLCEKWNGEYYNDGNCYITNDLPMCIQDDGGLIEMPVVTNWNFTAYG